ALKLPLTRRRGRGTLDTPYVAVIGTVELPARAALPGRRPLADVANHRPPPSLAHPSGSPAAPYRGDPPSTCPRPGGRGPRLGHVSGGVVTGIAASPSSRQWPP